ARSSTAHRHRWTVHRRELLRDGDPVVLGRWWWDPGMFGQARRRARGGPGRGRRAGPPSTETRLPGGSLVRRRLHGSGGPTFAGSSSVRGRSTVRGLFLSSPSVHGSRAVPRLAGCSSARGLFLGSRAVPRFAGCSSV